MVTTAPRQPSPVAGMAVSLTGVTKTYNPSRRLSFVALTDVTVDIAAGESVAIVGPSGSGKSTLLHLIGAMDAADSGTITVGGHEVTAMREDERTELRRRIGFVFQRFHLLPALSAADNVLAPVLPYKTSFDKQQRANDLLHAVGLAEQARNLPSQLSGGQQQRVAIARALVNEPGLLLADEPTGNLDTTTGTAIIDLLMQLRDEHGITLIIATHDRTLAARCDRTIELIDGQQSTVKHRLGARPE